MVKKTFIVFLIAMAISCVSHDIYQVGLAVSSLMVCFWIAFLFNGLKFRLLAMFLSSGVFVQLSVLARRSFLEKGLWIVLLENPLTLIVGDIVYGFKGIVISLYATINALVRAIGWNDYVYLDLLNYRFVVAAWLLVGFSVYFWRIRGKE